MPQVNFECEALAEVLDVGISEDRKTDQQTGKISEQIIVTTQYRLHYLADATTGQYRDDAGNWLHPIYDQDWQIKGHYYLLKKDGSLNEVSFNQLRDAFPEWNPADLFSLQDNPDLRRELVKIRCEADTYNGKTAIRVKWLSHRDSEGRSIKKTQGADQKKILAGGLGAKLKATFGAARPTPKAGGTPTAPKVPAVNAAPPAPKGKTAPAPPPPAGPSTDNVIDVNTAFAWFAEYFQPHGEAKVRKEWERLVQVAIDAGQDYESIDWRAFCDVARTEFVPF